MIRRRFKLNSIKTEHVFNLILTFRPSDFSRIYSSRSIRVVLTDVSDRILCYNVNFQVLCEYRNKYNNIKHGRSIKSLQKVVLTDVSDRILCYNLYNVNFSSPSRVEMKVNAPYCNRRIVILLILDLDQCFCNNYTARYFGLKPV